MIDLPEDMVEDLIKDADDIDGILDEITENANLGETFMVHVANNIMFYGKSLKVWDDELVVPIRKSELSPEEVRELYMDFANKIQIASHYYVQSNSSNILSASVSNIKKSDLITSIVTHHVSTGKSIPPNTVMERLVEGYVRRLNSIGTMTKIAREFWKQKLEALKEAKSCLNSIAISSNMELKYLQDLE